MRIDDNIVECKKRVRRINRFFLDRIETGTCDHAILACLVEGILVHAAAASGVDQECCRFHHCETLFVYHVLGNRSVRAVKGNIVALFEDAVKVADNLNAVRELRSWFVRVVCENIHLECEAALCNAASYVAAADQTDGLAV